MDSNNECSDKSTAKEAHDLMNNGQENFQVLKHWRLVFKFVYQKTQGLAEKTNTIQAADLQFTNTMGNKKHL